MRKKIIILSIILLLAPFVIISIIGKEAKLEYSVENMENISISYDNNIINCAEHQENGKLELVLTPVNKGKTNITIEGDIKKEDSTTEKKKYTKHIYVHWTGVITLDNYFGNCNGDYLFIISLLIILMMVLLYAIRQLKHGMKNNLYEYRNIRLLGLIIFIGIIFLWQLYTFVIDTYYNYHSSLHLMITNIEESSAFFAVLMLPIALITSVLVTISNIQLLKKEGKSWTNILGVILGGAICIFTIIFITWGSATSNFKDIYTIIISSICYSGLIAIAYLECILIGTIILGIVSAKHIPKYDKDYIIILGCGIKEDGTLFPLLKARVDRAIEFAKAQKEQTGKDIVFVPSGGQGEDEIISEAEAIKNYLIKHGIDKDKILLENKSKNTYENINFSNKLIKEKSKNPKIAFSTTNYHVLRAGSIAAEQKIHIEGIGAKTKSYYWINAFIREFIATLVSEKKKHIKTIMVLILIYVAVASML